MLVPTDLPVAINDQGCWEWQRYRDRDGYGDVGAGRRAHRVVYERLVGPIPQGLCIDHLCRNRACVNPAHLEPVTHAENMRRTRTHREVCGKGHPLDDENTYVRGNGIRECRACRRAHRLSHLARQKAAA